MNQITTRIESRMADLDLSLTRLAEQSGIAKETLRRRLIDPDGFKIGELERVAGVLDTTPRALLVGEDAA